MNPYFDRKGRKLVEVKTAIMSFNEDTVNASSGEVLEKGKKFEF